MADAIGLGNAVIVSYAVRLKVVVATGGVDKHYADDCSIGYFRSQSKVGIVEWSSHLDVVVGL